MTVGGIQRGETSLSYNSGLQVLRGLAATLVFVQHTFAFGAAAANVDFPSFWPLQFGTIGVQLFFLLSGFIMAGKLHELVGKFAVDRLLRIYPPFWAAAAIDLGLRSWLVPGTSIALDPSNVFLLPITEVNTTIRIPYWTLIYELTFYAFCILMILFKIGRRHIVAICAGWGALICLWPFVLRPIDPVLTGYLIFFSEQNLLFIAGVFTRVLNDKATFSPQQDSLLCIASLAYPADLFPS